jgi:predicted DNA-binding ribbon-helix-helix protein
MIRKRRFAESLVRKRSIKINGRSTSICLEDEYWQALKEIALVRELPVRQLVADIDDQREHFNLSSSLRLFVLKFFQDETEELATWRKQAAELEKLARLPAMRLARKAKRHP